MPLPRPVLLLRRTPDDVVSTSGPLRPLPSGDVEGHRGNELLLRCCRTATPPSWRARDLLS